MYSIFYRDVDDFSMNIRIDYKIAVEMTYGMLVLEIIHFVIVCIFEVSIDIESNKDIIFTKYYYLGILVATWYKWSCWWCNAWKIYDGIAGCTVPQRNRCRKTWCSGCCTRFTRNGFRFTPRVWKIGGKELNLRVLISNVHCVILFEI